MMGRLVTVPVVASLALKNFGPRATREAARCDVAQDHGLPPLGGNCPAVLR